MRWSLDGKSVAVGVVAGMALLGGFGAVRDAMKPPRLVLNLPPEAEHAQRRERLRFPVEAPEPAAERPAG